MIKQSTLNDTILFNISASDHDQPGSPNSQIMFSLSGITNCTSLPPYNVNLETGVFTVNGDLMVGTCSIVVVVTDNGSSPLSSSANFTVVVVPSNNYAPVFQGTPLNILISEDPQESVPIVIFTVTDADSMNEGLVNVTIVPSDKSSYLNIIVFAEVSETRFFFNFNTTLLDRETLPMFTVTLLAVDNAYPSCRKSNTTELNVTVLDENDNDPMFTNASCTVNIAENSPVGHKVKQLNVTDADDGINAKIFFSLLNENDTFAIDSQSGCITLIGMLLHAKTPQYALHVMAVDKNGASDGRAAIATVIVNVLEVNDNYPQFIDPLNGTNISVNESAAIGTIVIDVNVTDSDTGKSADITITDGLPFTVQGTRLVVSYALDYEVCIKCSS